MTELPDFAIEKACKLARSGWSLDQAKQWMNVNMYGMSIQGFAAYIAEHEEAPIDQLLLDARSIAADIAEKDGQTIWSSRVDLGLEDGHPDVLIALAALKRGIEIGSGK